MLKEPTLIDLPSTPPLTKIEHLTQSKWKIHINPNVLQFIKNWIDLQDNSSLVFMADSRNPGFLKLGGRFHENEEAIANHALSMGPINDIKLLNHYLRTVNENIETGGHFIGRMETAQNRKVRIVNKYIFPLNRIIYLFDYLIHRVWAKMPYIRPLYFWLFGGQNRAIPEMEAMGRLYFNGFSLLETLEDDGSLYFAVKKIKPPDLSQNPETGPLIRLRRSGKGGKPIHVYKFRTMFTYAQFLQQFVYKQNGLAKGGKIKNDPRLNAVGFIFRKYWLDELPMILNLLKGDIKFFGVRPISFHYLSLYPQEVQQYRKKFKPGLFPPFYADLPKTLDEVIESEMRYLEAYERRPLLTDFRYCCKVFHNIFFRRARSK